MGKKSIFAKERLCGCVHSHFIKMKNRAIIKCDCIFSPNGRSLTWARNRSECCWLAKFYNMDFDPIAFLYFILFFVEISNRSWTKYPHRLSHIWSCSQICLRSVWVKTRYSHYVHTHTWCIERFVLSGLTHRFFTVSSILFFCCYFDFLHDFGLTPAKNCKALVTIVNTVHSDGGWSTRFVGVYVWFVWMRCVCV